jgi:hypothetical protein
MPGKICLAVTGIGLGLIALTATACETASGSLALTTSTTTLMAGWERKFTLDWTVEPGPDNVRRLRGHISSQYGQNVELVRILALALDPSGGVVGRRVEWVPGGVPGLSRRSFDVPHLPAADHYLVTVWDYSILESGGPLR